MANLLERTRRLLQGFAPAPVAKVQYYNVACPEGHRLRGERTEGYQALRCPTCGSGIFVLPRSPLPAPVLAAGDQRIPKAATVIRQSVDEGPVSLNDPPPASSRVDVEDIGEIEWLDEPGTSSGGQPSQTADVLPVPFEPEFDAALAPETAEPRPKPAAKAPKPAASQPVEKPRAPAQRPAAAAAAPAKARPSRPRQPEPEELVEVVEPASVRLKAWAFRNRLPLLVVSVCLIVMSTVAYRMGRSRFQELPRIAEEGRLQGLPALDAGQFDSAQQYLSEASRAVDSLGGQVEGADDIRQGAREAAIYTNLVPDSLESILADASADPKDRDSKFGTLYQGRSIIIDAVIVATPEDKEGRYEVDYRIIPTSEGSKRVGRLDLSHFHLFEDSKRKVGDHVIFGARLSSLSLDSVGNDWLFGVDPDSGVYMTHSKALESFGWPGETQVDVEEDAR